MVYGLASLFAMTTYLFYLFYSYCKLMVAKYGCKREKSQEAKWRSTKEQKLISPPPSTIFSQVLDPPTKGQEKTSIAIGISQWAGVPRPWGRASPFILTQPSTHLSGTPSIPAFLPTSTLAVGQSFALTRVFVDTTNNMKTMGPA